MPEDELGPVLDAAGVGAINLRYQELSAISCAVSNSLPDEFIHVITAAPALSWENGESRPPGRFEIHDRRWWLDVSIAANRDYLLTAAVAAALVDAIRPALHFGIGWVAKVLPSVVAVREVRCDDTGLHIGLVRNGGAQVPAELADVINADDYADFVAAVDAIKTELTIGPGGTITVAP
ncbi:MAG TPA: hypothetical protein VFQ44_30260 [Streptosporangiaceae bacterium]|nr:hypothetical protein [Streptosporangiaceae bacterium]